MGLMITPRASLSIFKSRASTSEYGIVVYVNAGHGVDLTETGPMAHARKGSSRAQRSITPENLSGRWESKSAFAIASTLAPFSGGMRMYEISRMVIWAGAA